MLGKNIVDFAIRFLLAGVTIFFSSAALTSIGAGVMVGRPMMPVKVAGFATSSKSAAGGSGVSSPAPS